jgi:hypothetical protein
LKKKIFAQKLQSTLVPKGKSEAVNRTMAKRIENNSPQNTTQKTIDKAGSDSVLPLSRKSSLKLWNDENEAPLVPETNQVIINVHVEYI